jgi:hypothetical protein
LRISELNPLICLLEKKSTSAEGHQAVLRNDIGLNVGFSAEHISERLRVVADGAKPVILKLFYPHIQSVWPTYTVAATDC